MPIMEVIIFFPFLHSFNVIDVHVSKGKPISTRSRGAVELTIHFILDIAASFSIISTEDEGRK